MDEPNAVMRWVMYHFASGDALYGALLVVLVVACLPERRSSAGRWSLLTLFALVWGGISSPAWSAIELILMAVALIVWRAIIHRHAENSLPRRAAAWITIFLCLLAFFSELLATWSIGPASPISKICVIADSITAGLNDGEYTWPQRFAEQTGIDVIDASQPGATLSSALDQAQLLEDERSPLMLEIGGNDLLSGRSLGDFTQDLESLCQRVCTPRRVVWMCELPLPPLSSGYGAAQRQICRRFGIRLISKRRLMQILTTSGATVDSIHLSSPGQQRLCELMSQIIGAPNGGARSPGGYFRREPKLANQHGVRNDSRHD